MVKDGTGATVTLVARARLTGADVLPKTDETGAGLVQTALVLSVAGRPTTFEADATNVTLVRVGVVAVARPAAPSEVPTTPSDVALVAAAEEVPMAFPVAVVVVVGAQAPTRERPSTPRVVLRATQVVTARVVAAMTPTPVVVDAVVATPLLRVQADAPVVAIGALATPARAILQEVRVPGLAAMAIPTRLGAVAPDIVVPGDVVEAIQGRPPVVRVVALGRATARLVGPPGAPVPRPGHVAAIPEEVTPRPVTGEVPCAGQARHTMGGAAPDAVGRRPPRPHVVLATAPRDGAPAVPVPALPVTALLATAPAATVVAATLRRLAPTPVGAFGRPVGLPSPVGEGPAQTKTSTDGGAVGGAVVAPPLAP